MPTATTSVAPASEKQVEFLTRLVAEKELMEHQRATVEDQLSSGELTKAQASGYIEYLLRQPRQQAAGSADPVTEEGLYERGGRVYRVQRSKTSGNLYAKVLTVTEDAETGKKKARFEYAPGAFRVLDASARIGLERANELSLQVGACMICGRTLTAKESVQRGIGPICAGRV